MNAREWGTERMRVNVSSFYARVCVRDDGVRWCVCEECVEDGQVYPEDMVSETVPSLLA